MKSALILITLLVVLLLTLKCLSVVIFSDVVIDVVRYAVYLGLTLWIGVAVLTALTE